jgi:hypothetical protein
MSNRRVKGAQSTSTSAAQGLQDRKTLPPLPSVLDLGRQIVRLLNWGDELSGEQLKLCKRSDLSPLEVWQKDNECDRLMRRAADRRDCLRAPAYCCCRSQRHHLARSERQRQIEPRSRWVLQCRVSS